MVKKDFIVDMKVHVCILGCLEASVCFGMLTGTTDSHLSLPPFRI